MPVCIVRQRPFHQCYCCYAGFDSSSLTKSVQEPNSQPSKVILTVVRRFGQTGATEVHWEATHNGVLASNDTSPTQGDLVFATDDRTKTIEFNILPDNKSEVLEVSVLFVDGEMVLL